MSWLRKIEIRPVLVIRPATKFIRAFRYSAMALGIFLLSGIGWVSEIRPAGAQDIGRIIGGAISGGFRVPIIRERHRNTRHSRQRNDKSDTENDKNPVGDGKTFNSKGEGDSKIDATKVGDHGSSKGPDSVPEGGDKGRGSGAEKGPAPSEKPQGEAPNFTPR
jgi:hypothetical protein